MNGTVLINGAGGFLGSHTVEAFHSAGYELRATDMPGMDLSWATDLGIEAVSADLRDFGQACEVVDGVDGVINVAGVFNFSQNYQFLYAGNVSVTRNMCRAALEAGLTKFVHVATVGVYGRPDQTPIAEDGTKNPKNDYELTKKLGEDVVFHYQRIEGLPATSLRPAPIYGPRSRYIHNATFATNAMFMLSKKPQGIRFSDTCYSHHVHVKDVANAARLLYETPRTVGNAYNCADRTPIKWRDLWDEMNQCMDFKPARNVRWVPGLTPLLLRLAQRFVPESQINKANLGMKRAWERIVAEHGLESALVPSIDKDMFAYLLGDHIYDTAALESLGFDWAYPDVRAGIRETYDWLIEHRWLPDVRAA